MSEHQANRIHRAARVLVVRHRQANLRRIDFQNFSEAMFGTSQRCTLSDADLIRAAHVSAGMEP